jgi:hypothetical protein
MENMLYWAGMSAVSECADRRARCRVLLQRAVLWLSDQVYLIVALATTSVIFFAVRGLRLPPRLFLIPDALGLALFIAVGTQIALEWNAPWLVASLLGVITGVVGGVLRDVLCNEVPLRAWRTVCLGRLDGRSDAGRPAGSRGFAGDCGVGGDGERSGRSPAGDGVPHHLANLCGAQVRAK